MLFFCQLVISVRFGFPMPLIIIVLSIWVLSGHDDPLASAVCVLAPHLGNSVV